MHLNAGDIVLHFLLIHNNMNRPPSLPTANGSDFLIAQAVDERVC